MDNDAVMLLLSVGLQHVVDEPNIDSGFARIRALANQSGSRGLGSGCEYLPVCGLDS